MVIQGPDSSGNCCQRDCYLLLGETESSTKFLVAMLLMHFKDKLEGNRYVKPRCTFGDRDVCMQMCC